MPKASVNEDCYSFIPKDKIWTPRQVLMAPPTCNVCAAQQTWNRSSVLALPRERMALMIFDRDSGGSFIP